MIISALILLDMTGCATFTPTDPFRGVTPTQKVRQFDASAKVLAETENATLPQPLGAEITLEQALDMALVNNPGLAAASFDAEAALAGSQAACSWKSRQLCF